MCLFIQRYMSTLVIYNTYSHNLYITQGDQLRFSEDYPMVKTEQVGGPTDFVQYPLLGKLISSHATQDRIALGAIEASMDNFPTRM
jgi:hypothetical protein